MQRHSVVCYDSALQTSAYFVASRVAVTEVDFLKKLLQVFVSFKPESPCSEIKTIFRLDRLCYCQLHLLGRHQPGKTPFLKI